MKPLKVKCPKCNYEWETKSKLTYLTCVSCQRKFLRPQEYEEDMSAEEYELKLKQIIYKLTHDKELDSKEEKIVGGIVKRI